MPPAGHPPLLEQRERRAEPGWQPRPAWPSPGARAGGTLGLVRVAPQRGAQATMRSRMAFDRRPLGLGRGQCPSTSSEASGRRKKLRIHPWM